jgi:hypothetical protein
MANGARRDVFSRRASDRPDPDGARSLPDREMSMVMR